MLKRVLVAALALSIATTAHANPLMDPNGVYDGSNYVNSDAGRSYLNSVARTANKHRPVSRKYYRHQRVKSAVAKAVQAVDPTPAPHATMYLSPTGLAFIKRHEGLVLWIYDDFREGAGEWKGGKVHGTLTIGYGHTAAARAKFDFKQGRRIDDLQAEDLLVEDLKEVEEQVNKALKVPVTQGQYDALVSITFNCGSNGLNPVVRHYNSGRPNEAIRTTRAICTTSKGRKLRGLVTRRAEEAQMASVSPATTVASDVIVTTASAPITLINTFRRFLGKNPTKRKRLWCADAQNKALEEAGLEGTGSSAASSFKDYGYKGYGHPGDIALLQFGRTDNFADHVGTVTGRCDKKRIKLISGNDGGTTRERCIPEKYVVAYRSVALPIYASVEN